MIKNQEEYTCSKAKCIESVKKLQRQKDKMIEKGYSDEEIRKLIGCSEHLIQRSRQEIFLFEKLQNKDITAFNHLPANLQLIALRVYQDISQEQLAKNLNITTEEVYKNEKNEYCGISLEEYSDILKALGVHMIPSYVIGDIEAASKVRTSILKQADLLDTDWIVGV